jgi:hypothetical protein
MVATRWPNRVLRMGDPDYERHTYTFHLALGFAGLGICGLVPRAIAT